MAASLFAALFCFAAITAWALEWDGVALLETRAADGSLRSTRVWFAESEGELWLEAGTPENPWFLDVGRDPRVALSAAGRSGSYTARVVPEPGGHERIRALLRHKYGLRDRWVALLFDTSRSVAVRLEPRP